MYIEKVSKRPITPYTPKPTEFLKIGVKNPNDLAKLREAIEKGIDFKGKIN